jgi:hypothetical protein
MDGRTASTLHTPAAWRCFFGALATAMALNAISTAASGATRVHLRGIARIDAHAARSQGKLVLSGTVTDDLGAPAPRTRVRVGIRAGAEASLDGQPLDAHATELATTLLAASAPETCSDLAEPPSLDADGRLVVSTDATARYCLRLTMPTGKYVATLEALANGMVDGAEVDLPVDLAVLALTLRFDPERASYSLDDEATPVDVVASTEDDGITSAAPNVSLLLSNETGAALGRATTDREGRAQFVVPGAQLGPAGRGELRVSFAGSAEAGASAYAAEVERRTRVTLVAPDAVDGRLPAVSPESGYSLRVVASTTCAARGCSGAPTGTIEVRLTDGTGGTTRSTLLGAGSLQRGEARVVVSGLPWFTTPMNAATADDDAHLRVPVEIRYVPDAPWFEPASIAIDQAVRPPSPWSRVFGWIAGLGVLGWLALGRLPRGADPGRRTPKPAAEEPRARVALVNAGREGATPGWSGRIVDAHDGTPVGGARIAIERPGFERSETMCEAVVEPGGAFSLPDVAVAAGDRLVVEGRLHVRATLPLPAHGELEVALVSRRRALLERLVAWARRRGRPFDARPEPTPGHVLRMARAAGAADRGDRLRSIESWAEAVERAGYSGVSVDANEEAEVDRMAPEERRAAK